MFILGNGHVSFWCAHCPPGSAVQPPVLLYSSNCGGRFTAVYFFVVLDVPNVNGIVYMCVSPNDCIWAIIVMQHLPCFLSFFRTCTFHKHTY